MVTKEEAIEKAKSFVLKQTKQNYPLIFAHLVEGQDDSFYKFDHWSVSFQLPLEWDPNEIIVIVNAENGEAEGFPML